MQFLLDREIDFMLPNGIDSKVTTNLETINVETNAIISEFGNFIKTNYKYKSISIVKRYLKSDEHVVNELDEKILNFVNKNIDEINILNNQA